MASQQKQKIKGNPAYHRMSNDALKARRAASWARGQQRKDANRKAGQAAHRANLALKARGEMTPWEIVCFRRSQRRLEDPRVSARRNQFAREAAGLS